MPESLLSPQGYFWNISAVKIKTYCSRQVGLPYVLHGFTLSLKISCHLFLDCRSVRFVVGKWALGSTHLICHGKETAGVTNTITNDLDLLWCASKAVCTTSKQWQHSNKIECSFIKIKLNNRNALCMYIRSWLCFKIDFSDSVQVRGCCWLN